MSFGRCPCHPSFHPIRVRGAATPDGFLVVAERQHGFPKFYSSGIAGQDLASCLFLAAFYWYLAMSNAQERRRATGKDVWASVAKSTMDCGGGRGNLPDVCSIRWPRSHPSAIPLNKVDLPLPERREKRLNQSQNQRQTKKGIKKPKT